jgi:hypothetical protein
MRLMPTISGTVPGAKPPKPPAEAQVRYAYP